MSKACATGALEYDPSPTDPDRTMLGYNAWDLMDEVVRYDNGSPAPRTDMVWDADFIPHHAFRGEGHLGRRVI